MKTLQELYNEIIKSDELKKQFLEASKNGKALDFIKEHGCEATADEIKAFLEAQSTADKELSADELKNVAGGVCNSATAAETIYSIGTAGIFCLAVALESAEVGRAGQKKASDGRLCN